MEVTQTGLIPWTTLSGRGWTHALVWVNASERQSEAGRKQEKNNKQRRRNWREKKRRPRERRGLRNGCGTAQWEKKEREKNLGVWKCLVNLNINVCTADVILICWVLCVIYSTCFSWCDLAASSCASTISRSAVIWTLSLRASSNSSMRSTFWRSVSCRTRTGKCQFVMQ